MKGDRIEPFSAGVEVKDLDPIAVRVMAEVGVDISSQRSKHVGDLEEISFDRVVTVCDHARGRCPVFPDGTRLIHAGFDDPPSLARGAKTEEEALVHYRRVRDEIRAFVETLPDSL